VIDVDSPLPLPYAGAASASGVGRRASALKVHHPVSVPGFVLFYSG